MRIKLFLSLFLVFISILQSNAQTRIIGTVSDTLNNPIRFAQVILRPENSRNIIYSTQCDQNGDYSISIKEQGKYSISFSALSFKSVTINISTTSQPIEIIKLLNVSLPTESIELKEVIVISERPITVKSDTIVYKTLFFTQGDEQVVEDIIKKLPGLDVDENGKITMQGIEVEKVMVEGDDIFGKGYRLISRNLHANIIEEVEVYKNYSNNPLLKNIVESDKIAINLNLKKDIKLTLFGNTSVGYSTNNNHEFRANVISFWKKFKVYCFGNSNSIGFDPLGDINTFVQTSSDEIQSSSINQGVGYLINHSNYKPNIKEQRVRFNNSHMISLNKIYSPNEKIKIKALGFGVFEKENFNKSNLQKFNFGGTSFTNIEKQELENKIQKVFGKVEINYSLSKKTIIEYKGQVNNENGNDNSFFTFNNRNMNEILLHKKSNTYHYLSLTNKLSSKTAFILKANYKHNTQYELLKFDSLTYRNLLSLSENFNDIEQRLKNKFHLGIVEFKVLTRLNEKNSIDFKVGGVYLNNDFGSILLLHLDSGLTNTAGNDFTNNIKYLNYNKYIGSNFTKKISNFTINSSLDLNFLTVFLESQNINKFIFLEPKIGVSWELNNENNLQGLYAYNVNTSSLMDISENYILTSYRTLGKGLGTFSVLRGHSVLFNYRYGKFQDRLFINTSIIYNNNGKHLTSNYYIIPDYQINSSTFGNTKEVLIASLSTDIYLKPLYSNLKIKGIASTLKYDYTINSETSINETQNIQFSCEFRTAFRGFFNFHTGVRWIGYRNMQFEVKNTNIDNNQFIDLSFIFNSKFRAQINLDRYSFGNIQSPNNPWVFIDANIVYNYIPNKLSFKVFVNNLLNNNEFSNFVITNISENSTIFQIVPRNILFSVNYRF
jgi:hypothetical protein